MNPWRALASLAALVGALLLATAPLRAAGTLASVQPDRAGGVVAEGWVCARGGAAVKVGLEAGQFLYVRQPIGEAVAGGPTTGACPPGTTARGFRAPLPAETLFRYGGFALFATDGSGTDLGGSGRILLPDWNPPLPGGEPCEITNPTTLRECARGAARSHRLIFKADVTCTTTSACCGDNNTSLIDFTRQHGLLIEGNGHTLRRSAGQLECAAITVVLGGDVLVHNLTLEEDAATPPCELNQKPCANTINIQSATNVRLDGVRVRNGKGYVVRVWASDGFAFVRSAILNAGIIGLYVGHFKFGKSHNVVVLNSDITNTRTSALVLQGAYGEAAQPVLVLGNQFNNNHWHGIWPVPNVPGGITPGGQILIGDGAHIRVAGNNIAGAPCGNCKPANNVSGIEIGDIFPPPAGLEFAVVEDNHICYTGGGRTGIRRNPGAIATNVRLRANAIAGYGQIDDFADPVERQGNTMRTTQDATLCRTR